MVMWTPEHSPYCSFSQDFLFTRRFTPIQPQEVKVWLTVVSHIHGEGSGSLWYLWIVDVEMGKGVPQFYGLWLPEIHKFLM